MYDKIKRPAQRGSQFGGDGDVEGGAGEIDVLGGGHGLTFPFIGARHMILLQQLRRQLVVTGLRPCYFFRDLTIDMTTLMASADST